MPEFARLLQKLNDQRNKAIKTFLMISDNAIELLDILFEDTQDVNHDPTLLEASEYIKFLKECFDFFLSLNSKYIMSAISI